MTAAVKMFRATDSDFVRSIVGKLIEYKKINI
jgi:hypothetical protein